jgi:hypothetical protein
MEGVVDENFYPCNTNPNNNFLSLEKCGDEADPRLSDIWYCWALQALRNNG